MKRSWLLWLLAGAFIVVIVTRLEEIRELFRVLAAGQWQWLLLAVLLQVVYYILYAGIYQSAFAVVGQRRGLFELLMVFLASLFVNVAAPSGGGAGFALFADDAARRGHSPTRATAGKLLAHVADFSALAIVVFFGLIYLFAAEDLEVYQIVGAALLLALIGVQLGALLLGLWHPQSLQATLSWVQRTINRLAGWFKRPPALSDAWVQETAREFVDAAAGIAAHPWGLARTLGVALLAFAVDILSVYALFLAFGQPIRLGPLVAGFSIGFLFWIVAITPQGIGVVEGVMALVYNSLGVPAATATVIAITFRGLTFWIPLVCGFLALRSVKCFSDHKVPCKDGAMLNDKATKE